MPGDDVGEAGELGRVGEVGGDGELEGVVGKGKLTCEWDEGGRTRKWLKCEPG
jgi:ATP-dependent DNA ligase